MSDETHSLKKPEHLYPGMYFCGKDALNYANHLEVFLDKREPGISYVMCRELLEKLRECYQPKETKQ